MEYIILGHQNPDVDSILSGILLERLFNRNTNYNFKYIIPDEEIDEITKKIMNDLKIDITKYQEKNINDDDLLILVDHYEDDRYNNRICAIYDHHPTKSDYNNPLSFAYYNYQSCSTTTVIYNLFKEYLTKDDFILVIVGALVDTVSFKSTKTNQEEVKMLLEKCQEYNIDINNYLDMGLSLNNLDNLDNVYLFGLKKYIIQDKKVESSYIQIKDVQGNIDKINTIISMIVDYVDKNDIDIFVFIVHDMDNLKTTTYEITKESIQVNTYDKYTSRGTKIIPDLDQRLKDEKNYKKTIL